MTSVNYIMTTCVQDGKTDVVANDLGDRVTPCVVAFTEHEVVWLK